MALAALALVVFGAYDSYPTIVFAKRDILKDRAQRNTVKRTSINCIFEENGWRGGTSIKFADFGVTRG